MTENLILLRVKEKYFKKMSNEKLKIAVIGGGPAGMMAAIQASDENTEVFLFEKNSKLGQKLLVTGKGRCNITNAEFDNRIFTNKFGKNGKFLFSPLSVFGVQDVMDFFQEKGTTNENRKRR